MLATLVDKPFDKEGWLFETKWDGYRAITEIKSGAPTIYSRSGEIFNDLFPAVTEALQLLPSECVIDGEIVALDNSGVSRFELLQNIQSNKNVRIQYCIFDIMFLDGQDLRSLPLIERKVTLQKIIPTHQLLHYTEHQHCHGIALFEQAKQRKEEGILAKLSTSIYESGKRTRTWLKIKTTQRQEVLIIGYTPPAGTRKYFGSLLLAVYDTNHKLHYIGRVGTGFNEKELKEIYNKLQLLRTNVPPVTQPIKINSPITWVKPTLVAEVKFTEWTKNLKLRHPSFVGLREDKDPNEVIYEEAIPTKNIQ
jgi:bifunctional non-homologous end joining protein LigD